MEALAAAEIPFLSKVEFLLFFRLFMLTFFQQYLFEVNVVGLSSREALASDEGSIFPSWPYQEYQIRIDCVIDIVLSRHQAYGLRSYCVLLLFSLALPINCPQCTRPSKGKLPFHQLNGKVFLVL